MNRLAYNLLYIFVLLLFAVLIAFNYWGESTFFSYVNDIMQRVNSYTVAAKPVVPPAPEYIPKSHLQINPSGRIGIGVYFPDLGKDNFNKVISYEDMINHRLSYLLLFAAWGDSDKDFPTTLVKYADELDMTTVITWEPWKRDFVRPSTVDQTAYSLDNIIAGKQDAYIRQWAQAAKATGAKIIIRFGHEQTTVPGTITWYPWQGQPEAYKKAYIHIEDIFHEEGADNVKYMWNPISFGNFNILQYYPGDKYIDYIGLTVINHGPNPDNPDATWHNCDYLYNNQYNLVKKLNKPLFAVEFGSSEIGGSKPIWLQDCFQRFVTTPNMIGVINLETAHDSTYPSVDWRIESSIASLNSYKDAISSSVFR